MRTFQPLSLDDADKRVLRRWVDGGAEGLAAARRAHIVLLAGAGLGPGAVAEQVGCSKQTVITWRERYRTRGVAGLRDAPRSGRPATVDPLTVVVRTLEAPAPGATRWSTRTLAADLGISNVAVANIWRAWGISPAADGRVRLATEPALERPVAAVLGLHLGRGTRVLAMAVHEVPPGAPARRERDPGHLPGIDARPAVDEGAVLPAFLERLVAGPVPTLLVDGASEVVDRWAATRRGVALHAVPPTVPWSRLARVVCLAAAGNPDGGGSVAALRASLGDHRGEGPFTWTRPCSARAEIHVAG